MKITAVFTQGVGEIKRYVLDYTLNLATGETISTMPQPAITTPQGQSDANSPTLIVNDIVVGPGALTVIFFVKGGVASGTYYIDFKANTSLSQVLEDVVQMNTASYTT